MDDELDIPDEIREELAAEEAQEDEPKKPVNIAESILIGYLLGNYDAWVLCEPILRPEYFDKQNAQVIDFMLKHVGEYGAVPSPQMVKLETGLDFSIPGDAQDERTVRWLLNEVERFCRWKAMILELLRASELKDKSQTSIADVCIRMQKILDIAVHRDLGIEVHTDTARLLTESDDTIHMPTGYRHLDLLMGGGMPRPGMFLFAGKSGFGKSVMLSNVAINYAAAGKDVVLISFELSEKRIHRRMASMMTDISISDVRARAGDVVQRMDDRIKCGDGNIYIKRLPAGSSIVQARAYVREIWIKTGRKPAVLVLDYLDLMAPRQPGVRADNIHLRDKYIAEEVYNFLDEMDMMGFSASQFIKGSEEQENTSQDTVSGGQPKIATIDYLALIRRDFENDLLWLKLAKARDGGHEGKVPLHWNNQTLRITNADDELFYQENPRLNPNFNSRRFVQRNIQRNQSAAGVNRSLNQDMVKEAITNRAAAKSGFSASDIDKTTRNL